MSRRGAAPFRTAAARRRQAGGALAMAMAVTAAVVLLAGVLLARRGSSSSGSAGAPGGAAAAASAGSGSDGASGWGRVHRGELVLTVPVTGTLAAQDAARIGPPPGLHDAYQYKIDFLAPEGATVRKGDPVVGFSPVDLLRTLHQKEGERDTAQNKLEQARANLAILRRDDELALAQADADRRRAELTLAVPPELKSRNELDEARADLDLARRQMDYRREHLRLGTAAAEAKLQALAEQRDDAARRVRESQAAIAALRVVAPRDGTVVYTADQRGGKKKLGDPVWVWEEILTIPDLGRLRAAGDIDEADAGRVAAGQPVLLRLDAHPEAPFAGRVRLVRGAVQPRQRGASGNIVKVEIDLARTDPQRMRPGMRFTGTIEVQRARDLLLVPLAAVLEGAGGPRVERQSTFGLEVVRPRLGRHDEQWVEVLSGLREGDLLRTGRP